MSFTINRLVGSRALIQGTDTTGTTGSVVVDTSQWDEINQHRAYGSATEEFKTAVDEFFAPLLAASEKMNKALVTPTDDLDIIVLKDGVTGVEDEPAHVVELNHDSKLLRLVESGQDDRLVWVNEGLEILAAGGQWSRGGQAPTAAQVTASGETHDDDGNQL